MSLETYLSTFDGEPGYLDWASFGPLSAKVRNEVTADLELLGTGRESSIAHVAERATEARTLVAELVGGQVDDVTLQPSTTYGLMQAIYGLHGGILASPADFPNVPIAISRAAEFGRVTAQWLQPEEGYVTPDAVEAALRDDTRAVVVSLVDFRTGYRADLRAIREVIGEDRLLLVDAVQGFGVVEADYAAADVVSGNGYKWLRAGRGTGFAWFSARARSRVEPVLSGYTGTEGALPVDAVPPPAPGAQAFNVTGPDPLAAGRLAVALGEVRDAGVAEIDRVLTERSGRVIEVADRHGIHVVTPRSSERRAGIVALRPPAEELGRLGAVLTNRGVTAAVRGGVLRVSPHAGTHDDGFELLDEAFAEYAQSHAW